MKRAALLAVTLLFAFGAASADDAAPAGWTRGADGTYTHTDSGMRCPTAAVGYAFRKIDGASEPNFLGVCTYDDGSGVTGLIRVRRYVEGVGETPMAIQNDYGLMHPDLGGGKKLMGAVRGGPGPVVDGVLTYQFVMTTVLRGFMVDCIARQTKQGMPPSDFTLYCMKLSWE